MKFATLNNHSLDGQLIVVSRDLQHAVDASAIAPSLLYVLQHWDTAAPALQTLSDALNAGRASGAFAFNPQACLAPLPRSPQWLDASAFLNHGKLMEKAFNTPPIPHFDTIPVMYQGASDDFLGPYADVPLPSEADGIDFEGEFGVVVGPVPMAATPEQALGSVRLVVQINDWSLRALGPHEMKTGFGFLQAKPSTAFAPVAITPDELGSAWANGRVHLPLHVTLNGARFGEPNGSEMNFSFGQLVAHAARSRRLMAGCIIGSGTVSNASRSAGSACLSERRVIEMLDNGAAQTPFMKFGDRVRMQALLADGSPGPFGVIDQRVVALAAGGTLMRIVVTGAGGFVGQALMRRLLSDTASTAQPLIPVTRLTAIDQRFGPENSDWLHAPRVVLCEGDFSEPTLLDAALSTPPDVVFHLASVPGSLAEREQALGLRVNLMAPLALLERLATDTRRLPNVPKVVFASSVAVYGTLPATGRIDESCATHPQLAYGAHKRMIELLLADYTRQGRLDGVSLRLPGIVARPLSPTGHGSAFMSDLIRQLTAGQPYDCPVSPAARAWWMSLPCCVGNLLHAVRLPASTPWLERTVQLPVITATVADVVAAIEAQTGHSANVRYSPNERIETLFGRLPPLDTPQASALGFVDDGLSSPVSAASAGCMNLLERASIDSTRFGALIKARGIKGD